MVSCLACGCSKTLKNSQLGITFHRLPKNTKQRKVWLAFVNRDEATLPKICFVCSQHFIEDDFDRTSQCKVALRNNAVPSKVILRAKYDRAKINRVVYNITNIGLHNTPETQNADSDSETLDCSEETHLNTNEIKKEILFSEQKPVFFQEEKHLPNIPEIKIEEENLGWSQETHLPNTFEVKKETSFSEETSCCSQENHLPNTMEGESETPNYKQTSSCSQGQQSEERILGNESGSNLYWIKTIPLLIIFTKLVPILSWCYQLFYFLFWKHLVRRG